MSTHSYTPPVAVLIAVLALSITGGAARAAPPAPNEGMRHVDIDAQADNRGNRQALSTVSLPVGRHAWVQAGGGIARSDPLAGGRRPGVFTGAAGLAGQAFQLAVSTRQRIDGSRYRQADWGSSLDWRDGGNNVGVDLTHRRSRATGTVPASGAPGASTGVPAQARVSGTGFGVHGGLQVNEHVSVYAAAARNHYRSSVRQVDPASPGGLLPANPLLPRALLGGVSVVNLDEAALDHSAQVGATYRWSKVAVSGDYTTGQVHDGGGAVRSLAVKAAIDVAPGWRLAPGLGRGTSDQGGHANFASLSATYGW